MASVYMDSKSELVKNWLIKAKHDLLAAQKLSGDPEIYADVAIYHCQQSAEKAIKGFLILQDQSFPRTHDVRLLLQLAITVEPNLQAYEEASELLTPYATEFRYPSDVMNPTDEELTEALEKAEEIFKFVVSLLPDEIKRELV
jgi:HEPN domain-containing protein